MPSGHVHRSSRGRPTGNCSQRSAPSPETNKSKPWQPRTPASPSAGSRPRILECVCRPLSIPCAPMDDAGSLAVPRSASPEEVALAGFSPDAYAEIVGVKYGSDDVATVEVGFLGNGPHYFLQIHRWGEGDWRHEKPIVDDPLIDPGMDLAGTIGWAPVRPDRGRGR